MNRQSAVAAVLYVGLSTAPVLAQTGGVPMGGLPSGRMPPGGMENMTPEQARSMVEQMMQGFGSRMGLDPEVLRDASPDERLDMARRGGNALTGGAMQRMERMFGMSAEEMRNLSPSEKAALRGRITAARSQPHAMARTVEPRPLRPAPPGGYFDGSLPLAVDQDYGATLSFAEPTGRDMLLVVVDLSVREIVWREEFTAPFEQHLHLLDIAPNPSVLIVELIDRQTRRVIRRYRPMVEAND